jgi:hypothetical protein
MLVEKETKPVVEYKTEKEYIKSLNRFLLTTRFNNETYKENLEFRLKNPKIQCVYGSPVFISKNIDSNSLIFVIEMNNDTNKFIGIGLIRNRPICGKYKIYKNETTETYNRFTFDGSRRIDREEIEGEDLQLIEALEFLCFKGKKHLKRGKGFKCFHKTFLYRCYINNIDILEIIYKMFKKKYSS